MFLSVPVTQIDGSRFQYANCGPAVTAELINLASVDALNLTPRQIRNASGDVSGGVEGGLLASTANKLTSNLYPFYYRHLDDFGNVKDLLWRKNLGIIVNCAKTVKTPYRTNRFTGLHWFDLAGGTIKDGTVKYQDPGTTVAGWQRIPLSLLRDACLINGFYWILDTPATIDVKKQALRAGVSVFAEPTTTSKRLRRLDKFEEVHVRKTRRGGEWLREDGTRGRGWHVLDKGFCRGKSLR